MSEAKKSSGQKSGVHLVNIKAKKRTLERLRFSFQRIAAKLTVLKNHQEMDVSLLLVDISESGCGFYISEKLERGTLVELLVTEPKLLRLKGALVWSAPASSYMDTSTARFPNRCGIQFLFNTEAEREAVRDFTIKLKENILNSHSRHVQERPPGALPENFVGATAGPSSSAPAAVIAATVPVAVPADGVPVAADAAATAPVEAAVTPAVATTTDVAAPAAVAATPEIPAAAVVPAPAGETAAVVVAPVAAVEAAPAKAAEETPAAAATDPEKAAA